MTLSVVPQIGNAISTPIKPGGSAGRISTGSWNERNCATRMGTQQRQIRFDETYTRNARCLIDLPVG